ncbi:MAG: C1 family peptidase [Labilithrix sp.]|nr:C1 family peptidase [Labilithrix sp.]
MTNERIDIVDGRRRVTRSVLVGAWLASAISWGCATTADVEDTGEIASALPDCNKTPRPPICDPGDPGEPECRPYCTTCGGPDRCGGVCRTGACPNPGETCGGGGVPAQCGHRGVDLRPQQTAIRDQGGRDTCTVFATTAAVEAAYKRQYGLDLDLSEQFLHHFQKSLWLNPQPLPTPEIQPETNGGGNVPWQMATLTRYGMPPETTLPYIVDGRWQDLDRWTNPQGSLIRTDQRALDDFMLSASPVTYFTPAPITATVLPQGALEAARYRPTSVKEAASGDLRNLAWYKAELSAGREIAFDVRLSRPDPTPSNGVWDPGPNFWGDHAMLMVGFDDSKQAFWVKNSWGGTQFDLFSYDWVTSGAVRTAATILDVANPYAPFGARENKHLFLGRWNLDHDGWRGVLDVYRLPGDGSANAPDRRIGTYFGPDGVARRVNGTIAGNRLDFFIAWDTPNLPVTALQGLHFVTYVYAAEKTSMAGYMIDAGGNRWSVTAQKGRWLSGVPRTPSVLGPAAYSGRWNLVTDGVTGTLAMQASESGVLSGTFTDSQGVGFTVTGSVTSDPRIFTFSIPNGSTVTSYSGLLNGHARGIMAGYASKIDGTVGFHATRTGDL